MNEVFLIVTDCDVILRSSNDSLRQLSEFVATHRSMVELVYATKLHFQDFREKISPRPVPPPAAVIAGRGSEVCSYPEGQLDHGWINRISSHWCINTVYHILAGESDAPLKPEDAQFPFMGSCQIEDLPEERIDEIEHKLASAGIDAYCVRGPDSWLHVLPRGVDLGAAAAFVARQLGVPQQRVIVAGDSVFDARLFDHGFFGIVLSDEARVAADSEIDSLLDDEQVYIAQRQHAEGLCEGLQYWFDRLADPSTVQES